MAKPRNGLAGNPQDGRSALDAAQLFCLGVEFMRERVTDDVRMGEWKFSTNERPIKVLHRHRSKPSEAFHRQHRIFLSLHDVFYYIKRHDETIMEVKENSRSAACCK